MSLNSTKKVRNTVFMVFLLALVMIAVAGMASVNAAPAPVDIIVVGGGGIQEAIDAAESGDTIWIPAGTYAEQLWVNKSLNINGTGIDQTFLTCPATLSEPYAMITIQNEADVEFSNLSIVGNMPAGSLAGILIRESGSWGNVHDVKFVNIDEPSHNLRTILVENLATADIHDNELDGMSGVGIYLAGSAALVNNNIITGNGSLPAYPWLQYGIFVNNGMVDISNNRIENIGNSVGGFGIYVTQTLDVRIHDNIITGTTGESAGTGIRVGVTNNVTIVRNDISQFDKGIEIDSSTDVNITYNDIENNVLGIQVDDGADEVTVNWNDLINNAEYSLINNDLVNVLDGRFNYYGYNLPETPVDFSYVTGLVDYSPWLGSLVGTSPQAYYVDNNIEEALVYAVDGDGVAVLPGDYDGNLTIDHSIFLLGPNALGLGPVGANINATADGQSIITINATDVIVAGFVLDGNTYDDITGINSSRFSNITVALNEFGEMRYGAVFYGWSNNTLITENEFNIISGSAILIFEDCYAEISENYFFAVHDGIVAFGYDEQGSGLTISGNVIYSNGGYGLDVDNLYGDAALSDFMISGNSVFSTSTSYPHAAMMLANITDVGVSFTGNRIDGNNDTEYGLLLFNCKSTALLTISDMAIVNVSTGIYATDFVNQPYMGPATVESTYVLDGVTVSWASDAALQVDDIANGVSITVQITQAIFSNVYEGIWVRGPNSIVAIDAGAVNPLIMNDVELYYFLLSSTSRDIDATMVLFDGYTGAEADATDIHMAFNIEAKLYHVTNDYFLGFVMITEDVAYVVQYKYIQNAIGIIDANGHDLSAFTVKVNGSSSPYGENLVIDRPLELLGFGMPVICGNADFDQLVLVTGTTDVTIDGFEMDGLDYENSNVVFVFNSDHVNIFNNDIYGGVSGAGFPDYRETGVGVNVFAVDFDLSNISIISNNIYNTGGAGIVVLSSDEYSDICLVPDVNIIVNTIEDTHMDGTTGWDGAIFVVGLVNSSVLANTFDLSATNEWALILEATYGNEETKSVSVRHNWVIEAYNGLFICPTIPIMSDTGGYYPVAPIVTENNISGVPLTNTTYGLSWINDFTDDMQLNATLNWWGSATGPYNAEKNEDGQGAQVSDDVTFAPWLDATYPEGLPKANIFIDADGDQEYDVWTDPAFGEIQDAIDASVNEDVIVVMPGNYTGALNVTGKNLTLIGLGNETWPTVLFAPHTFDGEAIMLTVNQSSSLQIVGFTFNGTRSSGAQDIVAAVWVADGSLAYMIENVFTGIANDDTASAWCVLVGSDGSLVPATNGLALMMGNHFSHFGTGAVWAAGYGSVALLIFNVINGSGPAPGQDQTMVAITDLATGMVVLNSLYQIGGDIAYEAYGIFIFEAGNVTIGMNEIYGTGMVDSSVGIKVLGTTAGTSTIIENNQIAFFGVNIVLFSSDHVNVTYNNVHNATDDNIMIYDSSNVNVTYNDIRYAGEDGVNASDIGDGVVVNYNNIVGNAGYGVSNSPDTALNALHNWWGDITGPGDEPLAFGAGDAVTENVLYDPWLNAAMYQDGADVGTLGGNAATIDETTPMERTDEVPVYAALEGNGTMDIVAMTYDRLPIGQFFGADMGVYVDVRIAAITGTPDMLTIRIYFDPLNNPEINLNDLNMYMWVDGVWQYWDQCEVNTVDNYVEAWFYPSQFYLLGGTSFLLGAATIQIDPMEITAGDGFSIHIDGQGFGANQTLLYYLDGQVQGVLYTSTDMFGSFSVDVIVPSLREGNYTVMVEDENGLFATADLTIVDDSPLMVNVDTGSLYFMGETATWYIQVTMNGQLVPITTADLSVLLVNGTGFLSLDGYLSTAGLPMGWARVDLPLARAFGVPGAGLYALNVEVLVGSHNGVGMKSFQISSTLNDVWNPTIINIDNNVATIRTDTGLLKVNLAYINATVNYINGTTVGISTDLGMLTTTVDLIHAQVDTIYGTTVTIWTDIGLLNTTMGLFQVSLASLHAKIDSLNGTVAMIQTDLGLVKANISDIQLKVVSLQGDIATMTSTLGTIQGTVIGMNGTVATIKTDLGLVKTDVGNLQNKTNGIDSSTAIGIGVFTILAIIILIVVILRTRKEPSLNSATQKTETNKSETPKTEAKDTETNKSEK